MHDKLLHQPYTCTNGLISRYPSRSCQGNGRAYQGAEAAGSSSGNTMLQSGELLRDGGSVYVQLGELEWRLRII